MFTDPRARSDGLSEVENITAIVPDDKLSHPPRLGLQRLGEHDVPALKFHVQGGHIIHGDVDIQVVLALLDLSAEVRSGDCYPSISVRFRSDDRQTLYRIVTMRSAHLQA